MSYIGRGIDQIDNISTLDNLSFNGSLQTFNLTQNSVAFVPVSADALQIQIDGIIQSGNFSTSGSTVTFNFTPSGSSVCNGIKHFGVGVAFTPSSGSVTKDKTNFVSTSSSAGLEIKGDGTTDGTLQLNCSQNSHGIKLKSPPHSAGASYTLTFPNNDGNADQVLKTNGSGVLDWTTPSSSGLVPVGFVDVSSTVNTINLTNVFTSTYKNYFVMGYNLRPGNDNVHAYMRFKDSSGVLQGDLYDFANTGQQSGSSGDASFANDTSSIELTGAINSNTTAGGLNFYGYFITPQFTSHNGFKVLPYFSGQVSYANNNGSHCVRNISVRYDNSTVDVVTGFQLYTGGGTSYYDRGTVSVYGIKDS